MPQRNAIQCWLDQAEHNEPMGEPGRVTDPFFLGTLEVASGGLLVLDHWTAHIENAVHIPTLPGVHNVFATGIEIEGARCVSAFWMHHESAELPDLDIHHTGSVPVDSWGVYMGDLEPWLSGLRADQLERLGDTLFGQYADGAERFELTIDETSWPAFRSFTGRGSGLYDVYRMLARGKSLGAYIEFLWPEEGAAQSGL